MTSCEMASEESISILNRKVNSFYESLNNKGVIKSALWERFRWQIHQEEKYRQNNLEKIKKAIVDTMILDVDGHDILVAAGKGMLLVAESGVHVHNVRNEISALAKTMEKYQRARIKYFI